MKQVSSGWTGGYLCGLRVWLGGVTIASVMGIVGMAFSKPLIEVGQAIGCFSLFWLPGYFGAYRPLKLVADAVWDKGTSLVIQKGRKTIEVGLDEIDDVSQRMLSSTVVLTFVNETVLGREVHFIPPPPFMHVDALIHVDLKRRVDWLKREGTHPSSMRHTR